MDIERVKRVIHPEGYGFWLDPDGLFTLFGAIIATAALSVAIDVPEAVRQLGDLVSGAPVVATLASAVVYLATARALASVVQALVPEDFEETGRFHAWIAVFGIVLHRPLGIVVLANWPATSTRRTRASRYALLPSSGFSWLVAFRCKSCSLETPGCRTRSRSSGRTGADRVSGNWRLAPPTSRDEITRRKGADHGYDEDSGRCRHGGEGAQARYGGGW